MEAMLRRHENMALSIPQNAGILKRRPLPRTLLRALRMSSALQKRIKPLVASKWFEQFVLCIILANAVLIFFQAELGPELFHRIELGILCIFIVEFILRFMGRISDTVYFKDPWTYFDAFIITISIIPPEALGGDHAVVLRTLRVLRILRSFRVSKELSLIITVLVQSIKSLGYAGFVFTIFLYIYAVTGVSLFKAGNAEIPPEWTGNPQWIDPYGTPGEAMFTLFRILTGDDWTDLRYNLIEAFPNMELVVTLFHVSWMVLSAFLLINLVIGAIINNYDRTMAEVAEEEAAEAAKTAARQ